MEAKRFTIMTQNVFTDLDVSEERLTLLLNSISDHSPDIFCLQEAALKQHRSVLSESTKYHLLFSNRFHVTYRLKSYVPMTIFFVFSILLGLTQLDLYCQNSAAPFIYGSLAILTLILSATFYPAIFVRILACFTPIAQQMITHELDHQGLVIGIRKSLKKNINPIILVAAPFSTLGYEFPCKEIFRWPITWVQYTYLRPGYLIVQYDHVLVINAHFATGVVNKNRMKQVIELDHIITGILQTKNDIARIFICCDSNAHCDQPEIEYIAKHMKFVDCWDNCNPNKPGYSWSKQNELVANGMSAHEPNQRMDYIWHKEQDGNGDKKYSVSRADLIATSKPYVSDHFGVLATFESCSVVN